MSKDEKNKEIIDSYDYLAHAASMQDCTGLIPTPATSSEERESYQAIYPFEPKAIPNKKK